MKIQTLYYVIFYILLCVCPFSSQAIFLLFSVWEAQHFALVSSKDSIPGTHYKAWECFLSSNCSGHRFLSLIFSGQCFLSSIVCTTFLYSCIIWLELHFCSKKVFQKDVFFFCHLFTVVKFQSWSMRFVLLMGKCFVSRALLWSHIWEKSMYTVN